MLQKKVKKRASLLLVLFSISVVAIFFILQSLNNNILYFKSPTEIKNNQDINFALDEKLGNIEGWDSLAYLQIILQHKLSFQTLHLD